MVFQETLKEVMADPIPLIAILTGPTASGKTEIALNLPASVEILNADSMLFYREMNIGTAKPSEQELQSKPHHLINIRNPNESMTAGEFYRAAMETIQSIHARKKRVLVVGGSGFYLKALLYGLWDVPPSDPQIRAHLESLSNEELWNQLEIQVPENLIKIAKQDRYRLIRANEIFLQTGKTPSLLDAQTKEKMPDPQFKLLIIDRPSTELFHRINKRTQIMIQSGLIQETQAIRERYPNARALHSVGYAQVCQYLENRQPPGRKIARGVEGLQCEIELATRQLVKRQRTWLRGQKAGQWFELDSDKTKLLEELQKFYEN